MSTMLGVYNIIAVIPTGATLCAGLFLIYGVTLPGLLDKAKSINDLGTGFGDFGLLLIGAFVAGELVHATARICERIWWAAFDDWPSVKLLPPGFGAGVGARSESYLGLFEADLLF